MGISRYVLAVLRVFCSPATFQVGTCYKDMLGLERGLRVQATLGARASVPLFLLRWRGAPLHSLGLSAHSAYMQYPTYHVCTAIWRTKCTSMHACVPSGNTPRTTVHYGTLYIACERPVEQKRILIACKCLQKLRSGCSEVYKACMCFWQAERQSLLVTSKALASDEAT